MNIRIKTWKDIVFLLLAFISPTKIIIFFFFIMFNRFLTFARIIIFVLSAFPRVRFFLLRGGALYAL